MPFLEKTIIGKTFSVKMDEDRVKLLNRFADDLGIDSENYSNADLFDEVLKTASKRREPIEADKKQIAELQSRLTEFTNMVNKVNELNHMYQTEKSKNESLLKEKDESEKALINDINDLHIANRDISETKTELSNLFAKTLEDFNNLKAEDSKKLRLTDNQILVNLNEITKQAISIYAGNIEVKKHCFKLNQSGKYNGLIDVLGKNEHENLGIFLVNHFINSLLQGATFPYLITGGRLLKAFDNYKKN